METLKFLEYISFPEKIDCELIQPLLTVTFNGKEHLIDGYKRLRSHKWKYSTNVGMVENKAEILIKYIKANLNRKINDIEISRIFIFIKKNYKNREDLLKDVCNLLQLKYSNALIDNYKSLNNLIYKGKISLIEEKLNRKIAFELCSLNEEEQNYFLKIFTHLRLNNNKQKKVFDNIRLLSKRENVSPMNVLKKYFIEFLKEDYSKSLEQRFFNKLLKLTSPNYYNFIKNFDNLKQKILKNVSGVNLISSTNFEESQLKLEIFFETFNELDKKLYTLRENILNENL